MLLPDSMELRICVPFNSRSTAWASFDGRGRVELKRKSVTLLFFGQTDILLYHRGRSHQSHCESVSISDRMRRQAINRLVSCHWSYAQMVSGLITISWASSLRLAVQERETTAEIIRGG